MKPRFGELSVRAQLMVLVALFGLCLSGVMGWFILEDYRQARDAAYASARRLADATVANLQLFLYENENVLARLADRPRMRALDPGGCESSIREYVGLQPEYATFTLRDLQGAAICSLTQTPFSAVEINAFAWFQAAVASPGFRAGDAFRRSATGRWTVALTQPVRDVGGRRVAVAILPVDLLSLNRRLQLSAPPGTVVFVTDRENRALLRSSAPEDWVGRIASAGFVDKTRGRESVFFREAGVLNEPRLFASVLMPGTQWRVYAGISEAEASAGYTARLVRAAAAAAVLLLALLWMSWRVASAILVPVRRLAETVERVADGATAERVVQDGPVELRAVARQFNRMLDTRATGERTLRESEARYRTLIDWVPEPITVHRDMTFVYVNPAAVRLFGAARADDLVGRSLLDFVAPEWHEAARARAAAVRRDGACPLSELGNRRLDGTSIEVEVQSIAIEYDGAPAVLGVVRDISARKAVLRALRQSEARLLGVVQSAMDAIVTVDEGFNVVLYNDAAAAMFGAPATEVVGTSLNRFIPARFRVGHGGHVASFGREGRTSRAMGSPGQIMALRSDGEEFPVEASISHVDVEGRKLYTVIMRDVSRKVAAERELRLLGAVVAASPQAILIADARADDLPVVFVNPAFEATTGYAPADVIGRNCRFLHGADTGQPGLAALRAALAAGTNCQVLLRNYRKDGSMFWNKLSVAPLRDADGVLTHFVAMQADVSARESAVAALAESEARFRMLAEQAPVMIGMRGADRRYVYLNQAMRAFTGYTAEELAAMAWDEGVHAEDRERIRAVFDQAFETLTPYAFDYRRRRCDGEYRWLRAYAVPRHDPSGAFAGYIGTLVDITDAVEAEAVLRESAALLEGRVAERTAELSATIAELETMTMAVSHDLRAPLHRMAGFAGLLVTDDDVRRSPTAMEFADRIVRSAERMEELITSLLESARLGRAAVRAAMVPLGDLVRSYAAEVDERHTGPRIEWRVEALPLVYCDAVMARQVVQNLLENAVKYSAKRERPCIEVLPIDNPEEHGFLVRDNGVGFSMDQAAQLFGVFRRLHSESEFPGVGIGLANVHRIMQKHGGRVWCEAAPGQGATFFVAFPKSGGKTESESKGR